MDFRCTYLSSLFVYASLFSVARRNESVSIDIAFNLLAILYIILSETRQKHAEMIYTLFFSPDNWCKARFSSTKTTNETIQLNVLPSLRKPENERGTHERGIDTFYFPATVSPTQLKTSQQADVLSARPRLEVAAQDSRVPYVQVRSLPLKATIQRGRHRRPERPTRRVVGRKGGGGLPPS